jgi:lipoate-protein ligase A
VVDDLGEPTGCRDGDRCGGRGGVQGDHAERLVHRWHDYGVARPEQGRQPLSEEAGELDPVGQGEAVHLGLQLRRYGPSPATTSHSPACCRRSWGRASIRLPRRAGRPADTGSFGRPGRTPVGTVVQVQRWGIVHLGGTADQMATRELLREVAAGSAPPMLRLHRPAPTVAFGRVETYHTGFPAAVAAARRHGYAPIVRHTGGRAVAYHDGCLVIELIAPDASPITGLRARFAAFAAAIARALASTGVPASVGHLDGEFCPGEFSVIGAGRVKLAGTAQRIVAGAWLCSAAIAIAGAGPLRDVLVEVYGALGFDWRPATLGAVTDLAPAVTVEAIEQALIGVLAAGGV